MYVYRKTEHALYTVGYYNPAGEWEPESDHGTTDEAAKRVNYLNGGTGSGFGRFPQLSVEDANAI